MLVQMNTLSQQQQGEQLIGKYKLLEQIGSGANGKVFKSINLETKNVVAIKQIALKSKTQQEQQNKHIKQETNLLKKLSHPNIVKYIDCLIQGNYLYIVLEFVEGGSLFQLLRKCGEFPESLVKIYTKQILQGLDYLHSQGIVHRDIKGANILTTKSGIIKIGDFGVATQFLASSSNESVEKNPSQSFLAINDFNNSNNSSIDLLNNSVAGTPFWMAPEVIEMKRMGMLSPACDIWSLGCTVLELFMGHPPYHNVNPFCALYKIVQDPHPPFPQDISDTFRSFLTACFQKEPVDRATAKDLLNHPWISEQPPFQFNLIDFLEHSTNGELQSKQSIQAQLTSTILNISGQADSEQEESNVTNKLFQFQNDNQYNNNYDKYTNNLAQKMGSVVQYNSEVEAAQNKLQNNQYNKPNQFQQQLALSNNENGKIQIQTQNLTISNQNFNNNKQNNNTNNINNQEKIDAIMHHLQQIAESICNISLKEIMKSQKTMVNKLEELDREVQELQTEMQHSSKIKLQLLNTHNLAFIAIYLCQKLEEFKVQIHNAEKGMVSYNINELMQIAQLACNNQVTIMQFFNQIVIMENDEGINNNNTNVSINNNESVQSQIYMMLFLSGMSTILQCFSDEIQNKELRIETAFFIGDVFRCQNSEILKNFITGGGIICLSNLLTIEIIVKGLNEKQQHQLSYQSNKDMIGLAIDCLHILFKMQLFARISQLCVLLQAAQIGKKLVLVLYCICNYEASQTNSSVAEQDSFQTDYFPKVISLIANFVKTENDFQVLNASFSKKDEIVQIFRILILQKSGNLEPNLRLKQCEIQFKHLSKLLLIIRYISEEPENLEALHKNSFIVTSLQVIRKLFSRLQMQKENDLVDAKTALRCINQSVILIQHMTRLSQNRTEDFAGTEDGVGLFMRLIRFCSQQYFNKYNQNNNKIYGNILRCSIDLLTSLVACSPLALLKLKENHFQQFCIEILLLLNANNGNFINDVTQNHMLQNLFESLANWSDQLDENNSLFSDNQSLNVLINILETASQQIQQQPIQNSKQIPKSFANKLIIQFNGNYQNIDDKNENKNSKNTSLVQNKKNFIQLIPMYCRLISNSTVLAYSLSQSQSFLNIIQQNFNQEDMPSLTKKHIWEIILHLASALLHSKAQVKDFFARINTVIPLLYQILDNVNMKMEMLNLEVVCLSILQLFHESQQ